ncbi:MAG TPA: hypothetical protein VFJ61_10950 [Solirubrobacterales bacterium]|nr:hypothetical protein [Solirubrobacterales bacterium]
MPSHFIRHSRAPILEALADTRVVYVMGARQVGKSTLTGEIATSEHLADVQQVVELVRLEIGLKNPSTPVS